MSESEPPIESGPDRDEEREEEPGQVIFRREKKVDDDWKRKVEAEKDQLSSAAAPRPFGDPRRAPAPGGDPRPSAERSPAGGRSQPSPETFLRLIGDLAHQAMAALGLSADPTMPARPPEPEFARQMIDLLRVLRVKTTGNLTVQEQRALDGVVMELEAQYDEMFG